MQTLKRYGMVDILILQCTYRQKVKEQREDIQILREAETAREHRLDCALRQNQLDQDALKVKLNE